MRKPPKRRGYSALPFNGDNSMLFCPTSTSISRGPRKVLGRFLRGRVRGALCTFEIALSGTIPLTLLLVCSFPPRVHSIPRGPHLFLGFSEKLKKAHSLSLSFNGDNSMRLCFSRRVLARARTLSYVTERGSAEKAEYRELSPLNKAGRVKTI